MTGLLLFCLAEEAKPFVRKIMAFEYFNGEAALFHLVESRAALSWNSKEKCKLEENESVESAFIGASVQECQDWALENKDCGKFDTYLIAIADKRSAEDDTLLLQEYHFGEPLEIYGEGAIPEKGDTWYDFRVDYHKAEEAYAQLSEGALEIKYLIYY